MSIMQFHSHSDLSYPPLDAFIKKYQVCPSQCAGGPVSAYHIVSCQNPSEADSLMRVQNDLDETKIILVSG